MERIKRMLKAIGMDITVEKKDFLGSEAFEAEVETKRGNLHIVCYPQYTGYTARVDKPNGTRKWLYQKSEAQIRRAVEQAIEYYGRA